MVMCPFVAKKIEDSTTYRVGWGCNFLLPYLLKALVALEEAKHLLRQRRMKYAEK
jgi:hypothetical protein